LAGAFMATMKDDGGKAGRFHSSDGGQACTFEL
jgi:hypothetical protein